MMSRVKSGEAETVALVFCGGEGTRLQPLSYLIRKEMLPIGRARKPVLEFIIDHLRRNGIRDIVFLGSRRHGGDVANYFGDGRRFGVHISHQPDPENCPGTGLALLWAIEQLPLEDKHLLVYYGDILNSVDLRELLEVHKNKKSAATLVLSNEYKVPKGIARMEADGFLTSFEEKPNWPGPGKVGLGLMCIDTPRLIRACGGLPKSLAELQQSGFRDIMGDIIPRLLKKDSVFGYITATEWLDIGSFESYAKVREDVEWLIGEDAEPPATERGLSVFLSYHICRSNKDFIEDKLIPCLNAAGIRVVSGGSLERTHDTTQSPSQHAVQEIDRSDGVIAIVTPDETRRSASPSDYVSYEVAYAHGKGKLLGLFIQQGTQIPDPWQGSYTWTNFTFEDSDILIRDILLKATKVGSKIES